MKSFLRNVVHRKEASGGGLVGRTVKVGAYTVRVEAHVADGGFASIYRVRDGATGIAYALKHMRLVGDYEAIADCMTEVNTLKKLRDVPSVISLRAAAFTGAKGNEQEAYLLLDLCKENLVEFMRDQENKISTAKILQIFSSICQAVAAMHRQLPPLAHRDLKAENVLQHNNGDWVLCDFGSATSKPMVYESSDAVLMGEEVMRKYTTPAYRSPEMWDLYSRERIDTKADIWSLGCLLYFLMFGKLAFQAEAKLQILQGEISLPPTRPPPLVTLLRELLVVSPRQRPDILTVLRRLQEVADALNVDPALLVPRTQPPIAGPRVAPRENSSTGPARAPSLGRASADSRTSQFAPSPAATPTPSFSAAAPPSPQPASAALTSAARSRSNSFTKAYPPLAGSTPAAPSSASSSEIEGFANFEEAAAFMKPREEELPKATASPPRSQRSLLMRQPREPALPASDPAAAALSSEVASLRRQIAELQQQNQQLVASMRAQQTTIKQLQVDNHNQVLQLKRLGFDPVPSVVTKAQAPPVAPPEPGWASFDSPPAEAAAHEGNLAHVRTPRSRSFEQPVAPQGSPAKQRLSNGSISRPPQLSQPSPSAATSGFDPFGMQTAPSEGIASPSTDHNSANGTPSETLSRHSALSAFAESLKQPALTGEADVELGSPLATSMSHDSKASKTGRRSHRRSSSEPVENMNLFEERTDS